MADPIRDARAQALRAFHVEKLRIVMATGCRRTTAEHIASQLDIDEVQAEMLHAGYS